MYGEMGKQSNTMIFSERPGDVNALMAQASAIYSATNSHNNSNTNSTNHKNSTS